MYKQSFSTRERRSYNIKRNLSVNLFYLPLEDDLLAIETRLVVLIKWFGMWE